MRDSLWEWLLSTVVELSVVGLMMAGAIGHLFVSSKPISIRMMIGELLLALVVSALLLSFAGMQEWSAFKTVCVGSATSLLGRAFVVAYLKKKACERL